MTNLRAYAVGKGTVTKADAVRVYRKNIGRAPPKRWSKVKIINALIRNRLQARTLTAWANNTKKYNADKNSRQRVPASIVTWARHKRTMDWPGIDMPGPLRVTRAKTTVAQRKRYAAARVGARTKRKTRAKRRATARRKKRTPAQIAGVAKAKATRARNKRAKSGAFGQLAIMPPGPNSGFTTPKKRKTTTLLNLDGNGAARRRLPRYSAMEADNKLREDILADYYEANPPALLDPIVSGGRAGSIKLSEEDRLGLKQLFL